MIYTLLYGNSFPDIKELTSPSYGIINIIINIRQYAGNYKNTTLILSTKTAAEKDNVSSYSLPTVFNSLPLSLLRKSSKPCTDHELESSRSF